MLQRSEGLFLKIANILLMQRMWLIFVVTQDLDCSESEYKDCN